MAYLLEMNSITKKFGDFKALDNVDINVNKYEVHAICGENGAGKSTLMKVLSGVYSSDEYEGTITFNGEVVKFSNIKESEKKGIAIIHQELALFPLLSIAENIFIGNEIKKNGIIDWEETKVRAREILEVIGLNEDVDELVGNIGVGKQQMVEIAKAVSKNVKLLILDEPTASLNDDDSKRLIELIKDLRDKGITSIMISHKLNEIIELCDNVTIIRDGKTVDYMNVDKNNFDENKLIKSMVGRELVDRYPKRNNTIGDVILEVKDWNVYAEDNIDNKKIDNVNFNLKSGEVLGIAGLMGSGRTELAMSIFGKSYGQKITGSLIKDGTLIHVNSVSDAIKNKIAYVSEDRKGSSLIIETTILENVSLPNLKKISKNSVIDEKLENSLAGEYCDSVSLKYDTLQAEVDSLSGGNQQKVVIAKWLLTEPDILILDEPTRGIDVGAKYEIYSVINKLIEDGKSLIIISSELPELIGMCDRVCVLNEGKLVGEVTGEITQEKIMKHIVSTKGM